jgi:hypothetical protein
VATIVLHVGDKTALTAGDTAVHNRLDGTLDHTVVLLSDEDPQYAGAYDAVVIAETVSSGLMGGKYLVTERPVLVCEPALWDDFGLSTAAGSTANSQTQWNVQAGTALSAGLSGLTTMFSAAVTQNNILNSNLGTGAVQVARLAADSTRSTCVYYDKGATNAAGNPTTGKRIAFGLHDSGAANANSDLWAIFDTAISWMLPPGSEFDLDNWKLTLPTGPAPGDPDEIQQPALDTYSDANFHLDTSNRMVMIAPVQGIITGGSSGTRCEFREMQGGTEAAWTPFDLGARSLTVTGTFDPTSITGGTQPRHEMISGQIHGELGSPPLYLAAEYHVATPRIRVYKYNGTSTPGFGNMLAGITPTTVITYRIEYDPGADPANGTGRIKVYGAFGGEENLPATPNFEFAPSDFFGQTSGWYLKGGSYNKTEVASGSTGASVATISHLELIQPAPSTTGTLDATLPIATADLTAATETAGAVEAALPPPTAALAGTVAGSGQLTTSAPLPGAALDGDVSAGAQLAGTLPTPAAALDATTEATGDLAATIPLPVAALTGAATTSGALAATIPLPLASLGGDGAARGSLDATIPTPAAALTGFVIAPAELAAVLPLPASDVTGTVTAGDATLAAVLPFPAAALTAASDSSGTLDAALPAPAAALAGTVTASGSMAAELPMPTAALAAAAVTTGLLGAAVPFPAADLDAVATTAGQVVAVSPVPAAALAGTVTGAGTLAASVPLPSAAFTADVDDPESRLAIVIPFPTATLNATTATDGILAATLLMPLAALTGTPPPSYEGPLRAGQPEWGRPRLRAGQPELLA